MAIEKTFIPYGAYWSTPFCRWQGGLAAEHSLLLASRTARRFLAERGIAPEVFDGIVLGMTVPQRHAFYGAPWLASLIGAPSITGPTVAQACATSARLVATGALEIETAERSCILAVACDRTSNGPHVYYPNPTGIGGMGEAEHPVFDNFNLDPFAKNAMIETAEKVASQEGITREEQDAMTWLRYQQYQEALSDDRAFQRRYMIPAELLGRGNKVAGTIGADEGIHPTSADGLASLRPVQPGGTVTFGTQTHPADGNAGMVLCTQDLAAELSRDRSVVIRVLGVAEACVEKGLMPTAVVPAARKALARAGMALDDCTAFTTHNPFALNDVYFCRQLGVAAERVNRKGSSLVWGHPQAPTGIRAMIELIEDLRQTGGGIGLFSGCAAGDTAMAVVIAVGD